MKLKLLTAAFLTLFAISGVSYAEANDMGIAPKYRPDGQEHREFKRPENRFEHNGNFQQNKKEEFSKRLNLTEEQKQKLKVQRMKDKDEIKPILDEMFAKRQEFESVSQSTEITQIEKETKLLKLKSEMKELKAKADLKRNENMKKFEELLTDEQKAEFQKIKSERQERLKQSKHVEKSRF